MKFDTTKRFYVYVWYDADLMKIIYVGKGTNNRYKDSTARSKHFKEYIRTHNCKSFIVSEMLDEESAYELEKKLIKLCRDNVGSLLNVSDGGHEPPSLSNRKLTDEQKQQIGNSNRKYYAEHPEAKKEISDRIKEFFKTEKGMEFQRRSLQARRTLDFRNAQRERSKKANNTKEYKEKQSVIMKEISNRPEVIASRTGANNHKARAVFQCDLDGNVIRQYDCIADACRELHLQHSKISCCCTGKRKTTGGFKWKYVSDKV